MATGTLITIEVLDWLAGNPNITFRLGTGRSVVDQPGRNLVWNDYLSSDPPWKISSVKQPITTIKNYITNWNANCKPFT
jgi:hypothetical protein